MNRHQKAIRAALKAARKQGATGMGILALDRFSTAKNGYVLPERHIWTKAQVRLSRKAKVGNPSRRKEAVERAGH